MKKRWLLVLLLLVAGSVWTVVVRIEEFGLAAPLEASRSQQKPIEFVEQLPEATRAGTGLHKRNAVFTAQPAEVAGAGASLQERKTQQISLAQQRTTQGKRFVHVCICSDDPDLRPAFVAIRSAAASSAQPARLVFHFITTSELGDRFLDAAKVLLARTTVEVHSNSQLEEVIEGHIAFRASSGRKVLASPFNFAPFYLPQFLGNSSFPVDETRDKIIYLDADTLVTGDLVELHDADLQGSSCAAVPYCLQRMHQYINFTALSAMGFKSAADPQGCIANRGLMVIDLRVWQEKRITQQIERWLHVYKTASVDVWMGGMSQPPWLLALNDSYHRLGDEWNCNSLARESMSSLEATRLKLLGFNKSVFEYLGVESAYAKSLVPYVVTCSRHAKLLHYNGAMKPWLLDNDTLTLPVCDLPQAELTGHSQYAWIRNISVMEQSTGATHQYVFVHCADLWWRYMTNESLFKLAGIGEDDLRNDARLWANKLKFKHKPKLSDTTPLRWSQMIMATQDIVFGGNVIVTSGRKGVVVRRINPNLYLAWFKKREDKREIPIEAPRDLIRALEANEIRRGDFIWQQRHLTA